MYGNISNNVSKNSYKYKKFSRPRVRRAVNRLVLLASYEFIYRIAAGYQHYAETGL